MRYWLFKSEGECYGIDHLKSDNKTSWGGVRNYQARNFMMRDMKVGDKILFHHSNSKPSGVYGIAKVVALAHPDQTQFDKKDMHFDPKATKEKPIWYCVDVGFVKKLKLSVSLDQIKFNPKTKDMLVCARGSRLSIQPVEEKHFRIFEEV